MSEWIDVNDRLPENKQNVLVYGRCKVNGENTKGEIKCEFIKRKSGQDWDKNISYEKIGYFISWNDGYFWAVIAEKWKPI
jgi:hypothetical protein